MHWHCDVQEFALVQFNQMDVAALLAFYYKTVFEQYVQHVLP